MGDLEVLWRAVLERWDADAPHAAFLEACRARGALLFAASHYRVEAERAAQDGAEDRASSARKRLAAVALVATNELEAARAPREASGVPATRARLVLLLLLVAALVALVYYGRDELF